MMTPVSYTHLDVYKRQSMGFVMTKDVCDYNILYQKADKVLYEVKAAGRNAYFIKS